MDFESFKNDCHIDISDARLSRQLEMTVKKMPDSIQGPQKIKYIFARPYRELTPFKLQTDKIKGDIFIPPDTAAHFEYVFNTNTADKDFVVLLFNMHYTNKISDDAITGLIAHELCEIDLTYKRSRMLKGRARKRHSKAISFKNPLGKEDYVDNYVKEVGFEKEITLFYQEFEPMARNIMEHIRNDDPQLYDYLMKTRFK